MIDPITFRIGLILELKTGTQVLNQSDIVAGCSDEDERTRKLSQAVAHQRGIQLVVPHA